MPASNIESDDEFDNVIYLWSPEFGALPAGTNYAAEA